MNGILTRANPNIRIFDDKSADFSQIFEDLAKYLDSSNPNRASGGSNIRFSVHCEEDCLGAVVASLCVSGVVFYETAEMIPRLPCDMAGLGHRRTAHVWSANIDVGCQGRSSPNAVRDRDDAIGPQIGPKVAPVLNQ